MTETAYDRIQKLNIEIAQTQISAAKLWFNTMNLWSWGSCGPYANAFEKWCSFYEETCAIVPPMWQRHSDTGAPSADKHAFADTGRHHVEEQELGLTSKEQEIMQRQKPDYSNLRAAAQGDHAQSIIDNDAYWNDGTQGSNAKSPHKLGTDRERTMFEQRLNVTD
jgi:hypothetical protein